MDSEEKTLIKIKTVNEKERKGENSNLFSRI